MVKDEINSKRSVGVYTYIRIPQNGGEKSLRLKEYRGFLQFYAKDKELTIKREYVDRGSGFSVENRPAIKQMLEDISEKKDDVSFVLVYNLDQFSRNFEDLYVITKLMKKNNISLIIAKDNIDTSLYEGRSMMAILDAVVSRV